MEKGRLIILSGPSGVGKGTVREQIFKDESLKLAYSISMTTRSPRPGEVDGVDYFFVSREEFDARVENGALLEWAEFVGNCYGTPEDKVEELLNAGKNVMLEIEVQGALQVIKKRPDALTIFLIPPTMEELERRIRGRRTEDDEIVNARLSKAKSELATKDQYQHVVENDTVENATSNIINIIKSNT